MRAEAHIGFGHVVMGGWGRQVTHKQRRAQGKEQSWRSPEHKKKVVIREISDHSEVGLRVQTRDSRESKVCTVLGCSEKRSDPLVYLFFSFPSLEHIFLCWRLIYNSGNLLQREQVFLWDEAPWEAECTSGKKACHSRAGQRENWVAARAEEEEACWYAVTRQQKRKSFPSYTRF